MKDTEVLEALQKQVEPFAKKIMDHEKQISANTTNIDNIKDDIETIWIKLGKMSGKMLAVVIGTPTTVGVVVGILLYLAGRG